MFPLRAVDRPATVPFVTRLLIVLCVAAFGWQWLIAGQGGVGEWGVRPVCYIAPGACGIAVPGNGDRLWQPLFVSLFLHAGWLHLASNMLFLWVFGPPVEDRLGKPRFALLYLACGLVAHFAHIATHPFSAIPTIGASGAIAGVLGAYLILLPRSWILTYFPPIFLFPVPAPLFLVLWVLSQFAGAFQKWPGLAGGQGGVAWMAHIGGFVAGAWWAWQQGRKPSKAKRPAASRKE
jgi:membrane associated rhomboid family serine protease